MPVILSKTLSWTLDPVIFFLILLIATTVFASEKRLTIYLLSLIAGLGILCFTPIAEFMMENLEHEIAESQEANFKEYAVVLGGDNIHQIGEKFNYAESFDRVGEALRLYRQKKISKIIVAGGDTEFAGQVINEARSAQTWLTAMGVPSNDIITEEKSRSTRENAAFVKDIIDARKITDFYLITSASHMRRSLGVFRKLGMNPTPYAVDFRMYKRTGINYWNMMGIAKLSLFKAAIHEYAGIAYYSILGYL